MGDRLDKVFTRVAQLSEWNSYLAFYLIISAKGVIYMGFLYALLANIGEWLHMIQLNFTALYISLDGFIRSVLARKRK